MIDFVNLFTKSTRNKEGISRVFYCIVKNNEIVMLHVFIKKSQKTPNKEIKLVIKRMKEVNKHNELISKWKKDEKFNKAYDQLDDEFALFDEMLTARKKAGLTQAQVAEKMKTKVPAIARLEASGGKQNHSPSLNTLRKYAKAVGYRLVIRFEKLKAKKA